MRAPLSIVIPTLNAAPALAALLADLTPGLAAGLIREVIVSDGGSEDESAALAEAAGARLVTGPASRGGQLVRGCAAAEGDWLWVIHADTRLPPDWPAAIEAVLAEGGAHYGRLRFDVPGLAPRLVAGWANLRSRVFGLPYGDQTLLLPRALYQAAGGYPDQPLMEDVALARRLDLHALALTVTTSAARYQRAGWLRRGGRNLLILLRYFLGTDPEQLARAYR